ncbi:MAG: hypothetical protein ABSF64_35720 [Bryobacteraceae bacterium]|jgi:hypothetical protein
MKKRTKTISIWLGLGFLLPSAVPLCGQVEAVGGTDYQKIALLK